VSIEQHDVIDRISTSPNGEVMLMITDSLSWEPFAPHHQALLAKFNTYMEFIDGGQILEDYPSAKGKTLELHVFCKFRPTSEAIMFLEGLRPQFEQYNVRLVYGPVFGQRYRDELS
jgi:hypothetical protein